LYAGTSVRVLVCTCISPCPSVRVGSFSGAHQRAQVDIPLKSPDDAPGVMSTILAGWTRGAAKREVWVSKYQDVFSISRRCARDGISEALCTKFPHAKRQDTYRPNAFRCAKRIRPKAGTCWGAAEAEGRSPELREGLQSQTRSDKMGSE
jgi:hypothetical protein